MTLFRLFLAGAKQRELAEQYGVTRQAIGKIIRRVLDGTYDSIPKE